MMGEKRELRERVTQLEAQLRLKTSEAETTASGLVVAKSVIDDMDDHITKQDQEISDLQAKLLAVSVEKNVTVAGQRNTETNVMNVTTIEGKLDVKRLAKAWASYDGCVGKDGNFSDDYLDDAKALSKLY